MTMSERMWNDQSMFTNPPPVYRYPYMFGEINLSKLQFVVSKLQQAKVTLEDTAQWSSEKFVLSRLLFKLNNSLSLSKWHKDLKKVERCLKRFKELELAQHVSTMLEFLSSGSKMKAGETTFLPSRQMLEFLLLKLMGAAQLMRQTASYCIDTYRQVTQLMYLGHFVHTMLVVAALVSRIWLMTRCLALVMCQWYDSLRILHTQLKGTQVEWLPADCELPVSLKEWLEQTRQPEQGELVFTNPEAMPSASKLDNIFKLVLAEPGDLNHEEDENENQPDYADVDQTGDMAQWLEDSMGQPKPRQWNSEQETDTGQPVSQQWNSVAFHDIGLPVARESKNFIPLPLHDDISTGPPRLSKRKSTKRKRRLQSSSIDTATKTSKKVKRSIDKTTDDSETVKMKDTSAEEANLPGLDTNVKVKKRKVKKQKLGVVEVQVNEDQNASSLMEKQESKSAKRKREKTIKRKMKAKRVKAKKKALRKAKKLAVLGEEKTGKTHYEAERRVSERTSRVKTKADTLTRKSPKPTRKHDKKTPKADKKMKKKTSVQHLRFE